MSIYWVSVKVSAGTSCSHSDNTSSFLRLSTIPLHFHSIFDFYIENYTPRVVVHYSKVFVRAI